jgi:hypothetical protein
VLEYKFTEFFEEIKRKYYSTIKNKSLFESLKSNVLKKHSSISPIKLAQNQTQYEAILIMGGHISKNETI